MLRSGTVRSLTFKATRDGPNISRGEAIANSEVWEAVAVDAEIPDLPTADWDDEAPSTPVLGVALPTPASDTPASDAGSSAEHAATPPAAGRGRGRGRGRG